MVRDVIRHQRNLWRALQEVQALEAAIRQATPADIDSIEERFRRQLRVWFERKLVVIEDYDATGEEVVRDLVQETPPGYHNRVMGIQNIKGTGLDFIYRFQAWDACHQACELLKGPDESCIRKGLQMLNEIPSYGQLCQERVQAEPAATGELACTGTPGDTVPTGSRATEAGDEQAADQRRSSSQDPVSTGRQAGWLHSLHQMLEQFLDVPDSLRRRQKADQVYRDLRQERISRQEAVEQIRSLEQTTKRGLAENRSQTTATHVLSRNGIMGRWRGFVPQTRSCVMMLPFRLSRLFGIVVQTHGMAIAKEEGIRLAFQETDDQPKHFLDADVQTVLIAWDNLEHFECPPGDPIRSGDNPCPVDRIPGKSAGNPRPRVVTGDSKR